MLAVKIGRKGEVTPKKQNQTNSYINTLPAAPLRQISETIVGCFTDLSAPVGNHKLGMVLGPQEQITFKLNFLLILCNKYRCSDLWSEVGAAVPST